MSIEGVAVQIVKNPDQNAKEMSFHTFLADGKQQDSSVVYNHMEKLIKFLKSERVLRNGSTILCNTDGCSGELLIAIYFKSNMISHIDINYSIFYYQPSAISLRISVLFPFCIIIYT